ncbi:MAG: HAD family hydrolase [Candidatus Omnitrophota bacterium]
MKKRIRLIIFDLDGTLVNAYPAIEESFRYVMKKIGQSSPNSLTIRRAVGWGDRHLLRPFVGEKGLSLALKLYRAHHVWSLIRKTRFLIGAKELIKKLRKRGYRLSVASNRPTRFSHIILRTLNIRDDFDYILCGDKMKRAKPHPDILLKILKKCKVTPTQALYVGDMSVDILAGKRAHIKTIGVATGSNTKRELQKLKPYRVIDRVSLVYSIAEELNNHQQR